MREITGYRETSFECFVSMKFSPVIKGYGSKLPAVLMKRSTTDRVDFSDRSLLAFLDDHESTLPFYQRDDTEMSVESHDRIPFPMSYPCPACNARRAF
jgi:hypothetical protein